MHIGVIQRRLREFAAERDWDQFHSPKDLAMALAGEVGELLEIFQWLTETQPRQLSGKELARAREQLADVPRRRAPDFGYEGIYLCEWALRDSRPLLDLTPRQKAHPATTPSSWRGPFLR